MNFRERLDKINHLRNKITSSVFSGIMCNITFLFILAVPWLYIAIKVPASAENSLIIGFGVLTTYMLSNYLLEQTKFDLKEVQELKKKLSEELNKK